MSASETPADVPEGLILRHRIFLIWGGLVVATLLVGLYWLQPRSGATTAELTVYCAAGIRKPVEEAARQYQEEYNTLIRLDYGSSGEMEGKLMLDRTNGVQRCDLYIPADQSFAARAKSKGLTRESLPLAQFRVVLAVPPDLDMKQRPGTIAELLGSGLPFGLCETHAGVGKKTRDLLSAAGVWDQVYAAKKVAFPRVPEAANAIRSSDSVQAGFIWDTTARQFGLEIIELPELEGAASTITANVVEGTPNPGLAIRFARYLAAPSTGKAFFEAHFFEPIEGDPWAETPEINLYVGGVNRNAVKETLADFEKREGCRITTLFGGCGTLVAGIKGGGKHPPDAFLTCDVSYMNKVSDVFGDAQDVSSTRVVLLVRKGNPKSLTGLKDLGHPDLAIGTTDRTLSTLGDLSWQMFESAGVLQQIEKHRTVIVTTPTAHELILQMQGNDKLDVALVYEANCQNLPKDRFELVPIQHPRAEAVQNIAVARKSRYPRLTGRLMETMTSDLSKNRFETNGFSWRARFDLDD